MVMRDQRTNARGYGRHHKAVREQWRKRIQQGNVNCARCGGLILPWMKWCLDHNDARDGYLGPSHERCNAQAANKSMRRKHSQAQAQARRQSEQW